MPVRNEIDYNLYNLFSTIKKVINKCFLKKKVKMR